MLAARLGRAPAGDETAGGLNVSAGGVKTRGSSCIPGTTGGGLAAALCAVDRERAAKGQSGRADNTGRGGKS